MSDSEYVQRSSRMPRWTFRVCNTCVHRRFRGILASWACCNFSNLLRRRDLATFKSTCPDTSQLSGFTEAVKRPSRGLSRSHRKDRLRAIERLDLGFFIDAQHLRLFRRIHVETTMSRTFSMNCGSFEIGRLGAMRLKSETLSRSDSPRSA